MPGKAERPAGLDLDLPGTCWCPIGKLPSVNQLLTLIEIPVFRWRSIPLPSGNETFLMGGSLNIWGAASGE